MEEDLNHMEVEIAFSNTDTNGKMCLISIKMYLIRPHITGMSCSLLTNPIWLLYAETKWGLHFF